MGVGVSITTDGLQAAIARIGKAATVETAELMNGLGQLGASQTQRRIQSEKTSPAGAAWKKNLEGTSILFKTGSHLNDSIDHAATMTTAEWGSGWIGARIHQFGGVIRPVRAKRLAFSVGGRKAFARQVTIPARPYLGVSAKNAEEIEATGVRFIERHMQ